MSGASRRRLDREVFAGGGAAAPASHRWHFQHGPIDCIVAADGAVGAVDAAIERAWARFQSVLAELVAELPLLRADLSSAPRSGLQARGPVAQRMLAACRPHATRGRFLSAMAAVAGSVAEELIGCFDAPGIERAFVNNGGDIALHLAAARAAFDIGVVTDLRFGPAASPLRSRDSAPTTPLAGRLRIDAASTVRGVATSGWRGRSFSLGIADAATVLAASASAADAAATVLGNAVDVADASIVRRPASALRDDSDLGDRLVTVAVPPLPAARVERALAAGAAAACAELANGRIIAAVLCLQGRHVVIGDPAVLPASAAPSSDRATALAAAAFRSAEWPARSPVHAC